MSTSYIFSHTELQKLLNDAIEMYADARDTDGHSSEYAQIITVSEVLESFDGMREIFRLDGAIERSNEPAELHFVDVQQAPVHLPARGMTLCNRCLQIAVNAALATGPAIRDVVSIPHCERCHAPNRTHQPPSGGSDQPCDLPCHTAATHLVTTVSGNVLHLCERHAAPHRRKVLLTSDDPLDYDDLPEAPGEDDPDNGPHAVAA